MNMNFIEEFLVKRRANATNVFIIETFDPKRIQQFKNFIVSSEDFATHKKYYFDLQAIELIDLESGAPIVTQQQQFFAPAPIPVSPQQLLNTLRSQPTVLIISYAFDTRHSQFLSDFLVSASHDEQLYRHKSTIIIFVSDADIFPQVVRRFAHTISIPPSTPEERMQLLKKVKEEIEEVANVKLNLNISADLVNASAGLTLHDVETVALESFLLYRDFKVEAFTNYKIRLLREMGLEFVMPIRGFESVGGYDYLKSYIMNRVVKVLRNPDSAQRFGLGVPKGILLYGPPGTGKTWFAKALAKEIGLPMVVIEASTFLRGIVGETEARVKQVTQLIESLAPVVVFIDEFDQLTLSRQAVMSTDSGVTRRMTNMLLSWLGDENRKGFVVGATNYVQDIDPAFLRPGRLDEVIPVFYPDFKARLEILKVHTSVVRKVPLKDVNLEEIARKTYLWTGAELEKLVIEAANIAMYENAEYVTQEHFESALRSIEVNVSEREQKLKQMVNELRKLEIVNQTFLKRALEFYMRTESSVSERIKSVLG
jgi:SpoVK/Ycf46/Vps4 family AAA+-type ATPase